MTKPPAYSLDAIRTLYPHLGIALYAIEPGQPVTLELFTPGGDLFTFRSNTAADAFARAFPPEPQPETEPETPAVPDIFG